MTRLEWTTGLDALRPTEREYELDARGARLPDLLALLFVRATERVVRAGLRSDYIEDEDALPALRGRLLVDRQLRRRYGRLDRLECRYDERSANLFDNQLLLAAAQRCMLRAVHHDVRRRAGRLRTVMEDVCDAHGIGAPRRKIAYDRLNDRYRGAHELAWLLLEGTHGVEDLYTAGAVRSFAFLLDMNDLFEHFVERLLTEALRSINVQLHMQRPSGSVIRHAETGATYLRQIPDVLARLDHPPVTLPVDAKYKRYTNRRLDPGDVAQTFLYGHAFGPAPGEGLPQALIVYPSETSKMDILPLRIRHVAGQDTAGITAMGVPIVQALDEMQGITPDHHVMPAIRAALLDAAHAAVNVSQGP